MYYGIIFWCFLSIFCILVLLFTKIAKLKKSLEHLIFRILANIAVDSIDEIRTKNIFKSLIKEAIREYESEKIIKKLGDD